MGKTVRIGRSLENDLVINDRKVSRFHLQIEEDAPGVYVLTDLNSTNGTFVNGRNIGKCCSLKRGDVIRIGDTIVPWMKYFVEKVVPETYFPKSTPANIDDDSSLKKKSRKLGLVSFIISLVASLFFGLGILQMLAIFFAFTGYWMVIIGTILHVIAEIFAGVADAIEDDEKDVNFAWATRVISGIQLGIVALIFLWVLLVVRSF